VAFRILHVSDVHFGPQCRYRSPEHPTPPSAGETAARELCADLKRHEHGSGFRAIVVSGDLTWENKPEEFATAKYFLDHLSTNLGVPLDNTVVIPGNHDITWSEVDARSARRYRYLTQQFAERAFRDFYTKTLGRTVSGYLMDLRIFPSEKVIIVGFNSCRLHHKRDAGLGYVGREQVEQAIRELRKNEAYRANSSDFFKIAVIHHHLLPMTDLNLADLEKAPAERKFSLTVDAKMVLDLLLAENFAMVLHGHQHVPFCAIERRLRITEANPLIPADCQIVVAAAGSLCVTPPHATHNQFQVIDLEEKTVRITGVELHWDDPVGVRYRTFSASVERDFITRPASQLLLRDEDEKLLDDHRGTLEDSRILAENVSTGDAASVAFLKELVGSLAKRSPELTVLEPQAIRELFREALEVWLDPATALQRYEEDGAKALLPFPDYILRLMVAINDRSRESLEH
jgi:3',5'-cyclic AMP phosphodiesterase CpdA